MVEGDCRGHYLLVFRRIIRCSCERAFCDENSYVFRIADMLLFHGRFDLFNPFLSGTDIFAMFGVSFVENDLYCGYPLGKPYPGADIPTLSFWS